jgi:uncharacterized protein with von Willebrand factor type A (vWA) domain
VEEINEIKQKTGECYQSAFKLNDETIKKTVKQFEEISKYGLVKLFNLSKLAEYSSILQEHIKDISSRVTDINLTYHPVYKQTQFDVIKFKSFFFNE